MDDSITIRVSDLTPNEPVTMGALLEEEGDIFLSHAHYFADDDGGLNLNASKSIGGSFTGTEPMGLFWSIQPQVGSRPAIRIRKKDVTHPHFFTLSVLGGHVDANSSHDHYVGVLAQIEVQRYYARRDVQRVPVRHGRVRGTLFVPHNGQGQHPALIDMYGSTGGLAEHRAAMLASRGFTTLSLAYIGYQDLPKTPKIDCDYFIEAMDFLGGHDNVSSSKLGIIGTSLGANIALTLAPLDTRVRAVVFLGGTGSRCMFPHEYKGQQMSYKEANWGDLKEVEGGISWKDMMYNSRSLDCEIPVEGTRHTDFLFLQGTSDQCTEPRLMLSVASRLLDHGHTGVSIHMYQGTGHKLEPAFLPFFSALWHRQIGANMVCGGERRSHALAQIDAWEKIICFFNDRLR